jgi:hypothetical protein
MVFALYKYTIAVVLAVGFLAGAGFAEDAPGEAPNVLWRFDAADGLRLPDVDASLAPHLSMPIMSADLALHTYEQHAGAGSDLQSYTDETLVMAELPETAQRGAFELHRAYVAPHSLTYTPIRFTGDSFVKSSVIARVLQSEVDYVAKGDRFQEALTSANYKFSYKGVQELNGHSVHVYQVKPRQKRVGLFKGRVLLDAHTGALVRSEGSIAKSPSFFVRKIEFVQDYTDIDHFTVPAHLHTTAQARLIGKTVVDVYHRDYQLQPVTASASPTQAVGQ